MKFDFTPDPKDYLTAKEAADFLNISVDTIHRWDKKGLIKAIRDGRNYRLFDIDSLKLLHDKINGSSSTPYKILKNDVKSGIKAIELFAGAGGTALGLENAGIEHIFFNEINHDACLTLRKNFGDKRVREQDVHEIDFSGYRGKVDLVQAGFPCQAFSYAGKRLGFEEARGTLFFEFARCVKETSPKIAVGENVRGLVNHDNGKTLQTMLNVMEELGYNVAWRILKCQYLDVPQKRERLIMICTRKDLDMPIFFPKEQNYTISLREALKDCPPSPGQKYPKKKYDIMKLIPEGGYWKDLPEDLQKQYLGSSFYSTGGRTGMARRLSWDEPSLTLTCAPAQKQTERCHPSETRPLTVREYARIQTFPDSWEFEGSVSSQYKQIGNAVPPNLAFHIGECIIAMLNNKFNPDTMEKAEPIHEQVRQDR